MDSQLKSAIWLQISQDGAKFECLSYTVVKTISEIDVEGEGVIVYRIKTTIEDSRSSIYFNFSKHVARLN